MSAFHLVQESPDVVIGKAGLRSSQRPRHNLEMRHPLGCFALGQRCPQVLINDDFERSSTTPGFRLEVGCNIVIEG